MTQDTFEKVKETINETVSSYRLPENEAFSTDDQTLFEMIKLQVRRITISHSSYKKRLKDRERKITTRNRLLNYRKYWMRIQIVNKKKQQLRNIRKIKLKSSMKLKGSMIRSRAKWNLQSEKIQNTSATWRRAIILTIGSLR